MRKTFLREKENQAKCTLLTIDEEDSIKEINEPYDPWTAKIQSIPPKPRRLKAKTEVSSPRKMQSYNCRKELKESLQRYREQSMELSFNQQIKEEPKRPILKSLSFNQSCNMNRRVPISEKYLFKQSSQQKMRPIVMVQKPEEDKEEEKIRNLIKRKIMAKDLFRKVKNLKPDQSQGKNNQSSGNMAKIKSEKWGLRKNLLLLSKPRNGLPHIF